MARVLISWMAYQNDFVDGKSQPNPDGPNAIVHKYFYEYDYQVLLSSDLGQYEETRFEFLVNYLRRTYNHEIKPVYMGIADVINLKEIKAKTDTLLLSYKDDDIDIYISPGTPAMQIAWYFGHLELGLKTKLFQTRPAAFTNSKKPERIFIDFERSNITSGLIIKESIQNKGLLGDIKITKSIKPVYDLAFKIASTDKVTTLIYGETGTGKEHLARFIHNNSPRANQPFVAINCSAMGESLLESRLFGYIKGSHNVATEDKKGLFEEANGGTIFLDEIGDISPYMQQTLLRVLQEKKLSKIGTSKEVKLDIRIISATNKDLLELSYQDKFRLDLYYRLAVVELTLSPLRERGLKEMEEIFDFLMKKKQAEFNRPQPIFPKPIRQQLLNYTFPGNIRELENYIERIFAVVDGEVTINDLPRNLFKSKNETSLKLIDVENSHIKKVIEMCNKNVNMAARILDISRTTLDKRIKDYKLLI